MFIQGSPDDFTEEDRKLAELIKVNPRDVIYNTECIRRDCPNKEGVDNFMFDTDLMNRESISEVFLKEYGYA